MECEILDDDERFVVGLACSVAKAASVNGAALVITDLRTAADHVDEIMARLRLLVERAQTPSPDWEDRVPPDWMDLNKAIREQLPPEERPPPERDHGR